jgi:hypothetical protein
MNSDKLYCMSCIDNTHPSWDRTCLEFLRQCKLINEMNPVNNMPFFSVEQDWTLSIRPPRILLNKCFLAIYSVNSLPINAKGNFAPCRRSSNCGTIPGQRNPNLIPLPENNRYMAKEPGEAMDALTLSWLADPLRGSSSWDNDNTEGDVLQHLE